jgi:outer membrane protein
MKPSPLKSLVFATLLAGCALGAAAQEFKIGYINSERLLRESAPAKAAQNKLESEFGRREREITEDANQLKADADRLDKEAPTLSETERNRRQRELIDRDRDL